MDHLATPSAAPLIGWPQMIRVFRHIASEQEQLPSTSTGDGCEGSPLRDLLPPLVISPLVLERTRLRLLNIFTGKKEKY